MAVDAVTQFFSNRPIKNGDAVFVAMPQSGWFVQDDRVDIATSGEINSLAKYVADTPRYYAGDTSA